MKHAREDYNRIQDPAGLIPSEEPVFLLRGQDKFASKTLRYYASLVAEAGGSQDIIEATLSHANLMDEWPVSKSPDIPHSAPLVIASENIRMDNIRVFVLPLGKTLMKSTDEYPLLVGDIMKFVSEQAALLKADPSPERRKQISMAGNQLISELFSSQRIADGQTTCNDSNNHSNVLGIDIYVRIRRAQEAFVVRYAEVTPNDHFPAEDFSIESAPRDGSFFRAGFPLNGYIRWDDARQGFVDVWGRRVTSLPKSWSYC